ncbi:hypothetical protein JOM56_014077 [Amanita muscaria]
MFPFTVDSLTKDLSVGVDKPAWPLSTYGPAKNEPNLLGGLDESPEELRVRAVTTLRAGSANEYMTYEAGKISAAEAVYNNARTNLQQAFEVASKQSSHAPPHHQPLHPHLSTDHHTLPHRHRRRLLSGLPLRLHSVNLPQLELLANQSHNRHLRLVVQRLDRRHSLSRARNRSFFQLWIRRYWRWWVFCVCRTAFRFWCSGSYY